MMSLETLAELEQVRQQFDATMKRLETFYNEKVHTLMLRETQLLKAEQEVERLQTEANILMEQAIEVDALGKARQAEYEAFLAILKQRAQDLRYFS